MIRCLPLLCLVALSCMAAQLSAHALSEWNQVSLASPTASTPVLFALHHSNKQLINDLFHNVSSPLHVDYANFLSYHELHALARPAQNNINIINKYIEKSLCHSPCFVEWSKLQDTVKVHMSVSDIQSFISHDVYKYEHKHTGKSMLHAPHLQAKLHALLPPHIQTHVAYVQSTIDKVPHVQLNVKHWRHVDNAHVRSATKLNADIKQDEKPQGAALSLTDENDAMRNILLTTSDQELMILYFLTCPNGNDPFIDGDAENFYCLSSDQTRVYFDHFTIQLTNSTGAISIFSYDSSDYTPQFWLPWDRAGMRFKQPLPNNFQLFNVIMTLYYTGNGEGVQVPTTYPFAVGGSVAKYPSLLKYWYGIKDSMVSSSSPNATIGIGSIDLCIPNYPCENHGFYSPSDLNQFYAMNQISATDAYVTYDDQTNDPNNAAISDGETQLDIQFSTGMSPKSYTTIFHVSNTFTPFQDIIALALATNPIPKVFSFSYGGPEQDDVDTIDHGNTQFQLLGLGGCSVFVSSGDNGAYNPRSNQADSCATFYPSWPATSIYVTAVGASVLTSDGKKSCPVEVQSSIEVGSEITGGGGFSTVMAAPAWQQEQLSKWINNPQCYKPTQNQYNSSMRAFPDVTVFGHAYNVVMNGAFQPVDGTSASSPALAGMIASFVDLRQQHGYPSFGFLNPLLYHLYSIDPSTFTDITSGSNRCLEAGRPDKLGRTCCPEGFKACAGFDPVTGLGAPNFKNLEKYLFPLPIPGNITTSPFGCVPGCINPVTNQTTATCSYYSPASDSSNMTAWYVVGAIVAIVAVVALIFYCVRTYRRRKLQQQNVNADYIRQF